MRTARRIFLSAVTGLVLSLSMVFSGAASADVSSDIWCNLWAGANFSISASQTCPPSTSTSTGSYVALGDSVAAGLGLGQSQSAASADIACGRSPYGYPNIVASKLKTTVTNVSCSGATVGDLFTSQNANGTLMPAQLNTAFANGTPKLITITAGANDAHWSSFIKACYATNCDSSAYTLAANAYLVSLQTKLLIALSSVNARSNGVPPKVLITGYYNPLSSACAGQQPNITASELTWLSAETTALNQTIQNVSSLYSFAKFVPVDFSGHDICSANPWVQGLSSPAPFHPTQTGQRAIANDILALL